MREKFGMVHALRGVAALWVVLFHAGAGGHIDDLRAHLSAARAIFDRGDNGVAIFFALSGFVIAHSIKGDRITLGYVGRFALRRSIRLDPAYWVSIVFFLVFAFLSARVKHEAFSSPTGSQLLANLTYTQLFAGVDPINTVYWTLCYEVQFYLVLVFTVMAGQRFGGWSYVIAFVVAVVFGCGLETPISGLFVDHWQFFFMGSLAYWAKENRMAGLAFGVLCGAILLFNPSAFAIVCIITALTLMLTYRSGAIQQGLAYRPLLALGTVSYSLYLTHNPVSGASFFVLAKAGAPQWLALIVTVFACVVVAGVFWWAIERPTAALAQRVPVVRSETAVETSVFDTPVGRSLRAQRVSDSRRSVPFE